MSVYVDDMFLDGWCHMMADTDEELEGIARELKLKPRWRHGDHYDVRPRKRALAVKMGAIEVKPMFLVNIRRQRRGQPPIVESGE